MRYRYFNMLFFPILILLNNCSMDYKSSDEQIEKRALKIIQSFDSTSIEIFKTWSCSQRGKGDVWHKNFGDTQLYNCIYLLEDESNILKVFGYENFKKDFNVNIPYDSSLTGIIFNRKKDDFLKVTGINNHGEDIIFFNNIYQDSIFSSINPIDKFQELTALKDSFDIIAIRYYERLGGFIQIYLSTQHILTYVPDILLLDAQFKQVWIDEFSKGNWINKHWNLRKLDKPIDNH
jgi:hypothetical protein